MKKLLIGVAALLVLVVALRSAGDLTFWRSYATAVTGGGMEAAARVVAPRLQLSGAAEAVPRAAAEAEFIAAAALAAASEQAGKDGAQALIVHRHGHRVHEYFAAGRGGKVEVAGGEMAPALFALATGVLVDGRRLDPGTAVQSIRTAMQTGEASGWRNPWTVTARRRFSLASPPDFLREDADGTLANTLSRRVWQPLHASDAWLWGRDDHALRVDCCVVAQLDDWLRVGDLFVQQGTYQGERIVSMDWIRRLLDADVQGLPHPVWLGRQLPWTGAEPPAAREVYWFDLGTDARLWLVPRRGLVILYWAGSGKARDTTVPNIVIRGLVDPAPAVGGATDLNDLVPGHH